MGPSKSSVLDNAFQFLMYKAAAEVLHFRDAFVAVPRHESVIKEARRDLASLPLNTFPNERRQSPLDRDEG